MTAQDLSTYLGLLAIGLLTFNIILGLLISFRYQAKKHYPYIHINIFKIHNWTGYIALGVVFLHPVLLLFSKTAGFKIIDIAAPLWSPTQSTINTLGAIALYLLAFVVVTSYFRVQIGQTRNFEDKDQSRFRERKIKRQRHIRRNETPSKFYVQFGRGSKK